jgi:two-component system, cell cycle sensor histidine kinase and response regulator CckA
VGAGRGNSAPGAIRRGGVSEPAENQNQHEPRSGPAGLLAAVDSLDVALITFDRETKVTSWNRAAVRIFGHTAAEALGQTAEELGLYSPEQVSLVDAVLDERRIGRQAFGRAHLKRSDGMVFPARVRLAPLVAADGQAKGTVALVADITEDARLPRPASNEVAGVAVAELGRLAIGGEEVPELMERALTRVREALVADFAAVIRADRDGGRLVVEHASGWEPGQDAPGAVSAADPEAAYLLAPGEPISVSGIDPAGEGMGGPLAALQVNAFAAVPVGGSREPYGSLAAWSRRPREFSAEEMELLGALANVLSAALARGRLDELEARLQRITRLEAMGQITGGIAHDFNNVLAVILSHATMAREQADRSLLLESLTEIESAARRAADLTRRLLLFSRQSAISPRPIDVAACVEGAGELLARAAGQSIELDLRVADGLPPVRLGEGELEQVLVSLVTNAREAIDGAGRITVSCERARIGTGGVDGVSIRVTDDGRGMDEDVVERAFEPFFTTKPPGQATGLGLATVYGVVTGADGVVSIDSSPGAGTIVDVRLPAADPSASGDGNGETSLGGRRVLVVEDDPMVRRLAVRLLNEAGYEAEEAVDGPAALARLSAGHRFDVVLTDLLLPGLDGATLGRRLREAAPDLGLVVMTGGSAAADVPEVVGELDAELVAKPFTAESLVAGVRRAAPEGARRA